MKAFAKVIGVLLLFVFCFGFGYGWREIKQGKLPGAKRDLLLGIKYAGKEVPDEQVFKDSYSRIYSNYEKEIKRQDLTYAAMEGLVASLGDPYTNFFVPKVNEAFREDTVGRFFGIGARLLPDPLGVKVVTVFDDGPAQKGGIKSEDVIIAVDDVVVAGKNSDDIVSMIKGQEGTTVKIKIMRPNVAEPIQFVLKRAKVVPPNVDHKYLKESGVGYVRLLNFNLEIPEQFDQALNKLETEPLKGLVIDLRENPGGSLDAAVSVLSRFISEKKVVSLRLKGGDEEVSYANAFSKRDFGYPIVVLVNEESASAAEIMAGVLKDYGVAKLVGEHTFGKFAVQTVFQQKDGSGIKVTIAKYFLPKSGALARKIDEDGQYISGGIQPDVKVDLDPDEEFEIGNPAKDGQLRKAIEVVLGK